MTDFDPDWIANLPCAVTVCDKNYKVVYMNDLSAEFNSDGGGKALVGTSLMDCHTPDSQEKLRALMKTEGPNIYTSEKKGVKKMVFQARWKKRGRPAGLVEVLFVLPPKVPNHRRT